jgi:HSP20 family protein
MKNHPLFCSDCLVYPGEYTPMREKEKASFRLKNSRQETVITPAINMDEYDDHYRVEVLIPGVRRENILVHVLDNLLHISVMNDISQEAERKLQVHEFNPGRVERKLLLPENADTEFVSAEYKYGILKLYIPKAAEIIQQNNNNIVVY